MLGLLKVLLSLCLMVAAYSLGYHSCMLALMTRHAPDHPSRPALTKIAQGALWSTLVFFLVSSGMAAL